MENNKKKKLIDQIPIPEVEHIKIHDIDTIGRPHPYCITPKHLQTDRIVLDADAIRDAEKNHGAKCNICKNLVRRRKQDRILSYDEHTTDIVLFLKIPKVSDLNGIPGLNAYLKKVKPVLEKLKIDGVAFIPKEE